MTQEQFVNIVRNTIDSCQCILIGKGKEYAGDEDRLANFKDIAFDLGVTPEQVCLTYFDKHMRAIKTCIREGKVSVEAETRIQDCINYLFFLQALQIEREEGEKKKGDKIEIAYAIEKGLPYEEEIKPIKISLAEHDIRVEKEMLLKSQKKEDTVTHDFFTMSKQGRMVLKYRGEERDLLCSSEEYQDILDGKFGSKFYIFNLVRDYFIKNKKRPFLNQLLLKSAYAKEGPSKIFAAFDEARKLRRAAMTQEERDVEDAVDSIL